MARVCIRGKPVFATAPYVEDASGALRVILPERCVFWSETERCSLFVDHYRSRKTGPRFPVAVVGCSTHPHGRYTLYPPGHVPFGREAAVPSSPAGALLRDPEGQPVWEATLFAAAVDAAKGGRWPADSPWDNPRRRRTQGHRLKWAGRFLGVHPTLGARERERIATRLGVPTLVLRSAARSWGASWRLRGAAVLAVLLALTIDTSLLDRMLAAGAVADLWPAPRRWEAARQTWVPPRSRPPEPPERDLARGRDSPPTNLPAAGGRRPP